MMELRTDRVRILYIAGLGRSGSTLLGRILGTAEGAFYAGELRYLWEFGVIGGHRCGCDKQVAECEVWSNVLALVGQSHPELAQEVFSHLRRTLTKTRHLPLLATPLGRRLLGPRLRHYIAGLEALYEGIARVTGCTIVVDSSSSPVYGYALRLCGSMDTSIVHLVRDPRAHAHSWRRVKDWGDPDVPESMPRFSVIESALWWIVWNLITERFLSQDAKPPIRIRYEDMITLAPGSILALAASLGVNLPTATLTDASPPRLNLPRSHSVAGNPVRHNVGGVELRLDDAWLREMDRPSSLLVSAICWPLAARYGYPRVARRGDFHRGQRD